VLLALVGITARASAAPIQQFPAGSNPVAVAIADMDGDGKPDIVTPNYSGNVCVLLGDGALGFAAPIPNVFGGGNLRGLALADLNGDGLPDAVTADGFANTISVLLGIGGGVLGAATSLPAGNGVFAVALGDIDGDGKLDAATANFLGNDVSVIVGNGAGGFGSPASSPVGNGAYSVAIGDFNGDGTADLVSTNAIPSTISVLLGTGGGSLGAALSKSVGFSPFHVAIADWNGDGNQDLVTANNSAGSVSILIGNGAGAFAAASSLATAPGASCVAIGDLNGDAKSDLVVANTGAGPLWVGSATILLGTGGGGFAANPTNYYIGYKSIGVALADLNGDGTLDLVTANYLGANVTAVAGDGLGRFRAPLGFAVGSDPNDLAVGDWSGDGIPDLVVETGDQNVRTLKGLGNGAFSNPTMYALGDAGFGIALADLNADGFLDIVTNSGSSTVTILFGAAGGVFGAPIHLPAPMGSNHSLAIGDMNGDGLPDLVRAMPTFNTVSILVATAPGSFGPTIPVFVGNPPSAIALGDVDKDGFMDIVASSGPSGNAVLVTLGAGGGSFAPTAAYAAGSSSQLSGDIVLSDVSGDGFLDIVTLTGYPTAVSVLVGNGLGFFAPANNFAGVPFLASMTVGDVDGAGHPDVLGTVSSQAGFSGSQFEMLGDGAGGFPNTNNLGWGPPIAFAAIRDLDGDGYADIVATSPVSNEVVVVPSASAGHVGSLGYGKGTRGCQGKLSMGCNGPPKVNDPNYVLTCANAPRNALGLGVITNLPDVAGSDSLGIGLIFQLDLLQSTLVIPLNIRSDWSGTSSVPAPIPNDPGLVGQAFYAQAIWLEDATTGQACSAALGHLVSSGGLQITVQP
jgi:hypothetical protein